MKFAVSGIFLFILAHNLFGQDYPVTDRSFAYTTAFTMPASTAMLESGYYHVNSNQPGSIQDISGQSFLLRYGVNSFTELRIRCGFMYLNFEPAEAGGLVPLEISMKNRLLPEGRISPAVFMLSEFTIPNTGNTDLQTAKLRPSVRLIVEKFLNNLFILGGNFGYKWQDDGERSLTYSTSLRIALDASYSIYAEFYGSNSNVMSSANFVDVAAEFWITPHFVLDIAYGIGITDSADDDFISVGGAWRISD